MTFPNRATALLVAALVTLVLVSGCIDEPLTQQEAEARTETAMSSFASAMSSREGGGIKLLEGTMEGNLGDEGGMSFGPSDMQADMRIEWGQNDVVYAKIDVDSGGFSVHVESWCTPSKTFFKWGGEVYESRASSIDSDEDLCRGFEDADLESGMMFLDSEDLEGLDKGEVTVNDDGTITAVYTDPDDGATTMTITIDEQGRVSRFEMASKDFSGVFDVKYGGRDAITVPEATGRIPASVWTEQDYAGDDAYGSDPDYAQQPDVTTYRVSESAETPLLAEMEARWVEGDWGSDEKEVLATFTLTGGRQTQGDVTFEYFDADADGRVSVGDRYEVVAPTDDAGGDQWSRSRSVALYDLWAEGYVNESPIPAPGLVGLLAVLGVALLLLRRR